MLQEILKTLLEESMDNTYKALESTCGPGIPSKQKKVQVSGVCSFQCLSAAIKDMLGPDLYIDYKINLFTHIQDRFQKLYQSTQPLIEGDAKKQALNVLDQNFLKDNALAIAALRIKKEILNQKTKTLIKDPISKNRIVNRKNIILFFSRILNGIKAILLEIFKLMSFIISQKTLINN